MLLKTRFLASRAAFFETFEDSGPFVKTRSFFVDQTSEFLCRKFVEAVSQNFAVFLMAYTVSQLLMNILMHWLTA